MESVVENVSATRKTLTLSFTAEEVNALLDEGVASYRNDVALPGFRKGKVPATMIEKRFGDEIRATVTQNTLQKNVDAALREKNLRPVGGMNADYSTLFARNIGFACKVTFDTLPEIDFPVYEGVEVNQDKVADVTDADVAAVLDQLQHNYADVVNASEVRCPKEGDAAVVDYEGFDEKGEPVADVKGVNLTVNIGKGEVLPDFEALLKSVKVGEEKEGPVAFPENYAHKPLAGKTVTFKVKLTAIRETILPELNDELAKRTGQDSMESLKEAIRENLRLQWIQGARGRAMDALLNGLLENLSFELPEKMVEDRTQRIKDDHLYQLRRAGQTPEKLGKTDEDMTKEAREEAIESLRPQVFLMALAQKENLSVSDYEISLAVYNIAQRAGRDYNELLDSYKKSGFIFDLQDRLLADKGMEFVYSKAKITEVDPNAAPDEDVKEEAKSEEEAKQPAKKARKSSKKAAEDAKSAE
ncbi:MAG: trigger factor [Desulfovibrionaceae bacterium]|nr:trigger factor [Desulfovibrionaceae bacterium]